MRQLMSLKVCRLLIALTLAACPYHAYPQVDLEPEEPEAETGSGGDLSLSAATPKASTTYAAQTKEYLSRAETARRRGNIKTQIAELRRAHAVTDGKDSNVLNQLAGALLSTGDRDAARRIREEFLGTDLNPEEKLAQAATLAVYAADIADTRTADKWMAYAESLFRQLGDSENALLAQARLHSTRNALLLAQGKYREGEAEARLAASALRKLAEATGGKSSANLRYWRNLIDSQLASAMVRQGRMAESEWIYRDTLARSARETGARSLPSARFALALANAQLRQGRFEDALHHATAALRTLERREAAKSTNTLANALLLVGWSQVLAERFEPAAAAFSRRAQILTAGNGGSVVWGYAMIRAGRATAAVPMLRAHYEAALRRSPGIYATRERAGMYAYALLRAGRASEANALFAITMPGLISARQSRRATDRADLLLETISNWIIEGYLEAAAHDAETGNAKAIAEMFRLSRRCSGLPMWREHPRSSAHLRSQAQEPGSPTPSWRASPGASRTWAISRRRAAGLSRSCSPGRARSRR